ncbi:hypothetical protein [Bosea rubneri]|uniref:TRAP-type C4-dicarboxylate transport system, small permease component n=1 Tax=Bosea rubneri TaxID=3075434 RepID=A0ABU3SFI3_9HYPH|nr:hypothetical protein [Bosea sp. ZW T0_25]MDU0343550.1 hypothetical protein [Bosea sp. ZW T0_25]
MTARPRLAYGILLLLQTICAALLLFYIHMAFRIVTEKPGELHSLPASILLQVVIAILIGQSCYWTRLGHVPVPDGIYSPVLGHLLAFAGRLSSIFGGALFSIYFLRQLPAIQQLSLDAGLLWRCLLVFAMLFAIYCYTLELERLGAAWQKQREPEDQRQPGRPAS